PLSDLWRDFPAHCITSLVWLGQCGGVRGIGDDRAARVDPRGRNAVVLERGGDNAAVDQLAGTDDGVVSAWRSGAQNGRGLEQRAQVVELRAHFDQDVVGEVGG